MYQICQTVCPIPLFGREALVSLLQISDHAHGLRGTTMNNHTHEEHLHSHHEEHDHEHRHTHGHSHPSSLALNTWKALCECITTAGIMTLQEITAALTARQSKRSKKQADMALMPYTLTAMPREPVKKSSRILKICLKLGGTSQDMEIVDDSTSAGGGTGSPQASETMCRSYGMPIDIAQQAFLGPSLHSQAHALYSDNSAPNQTQ